MLEKKFEMVKPFRVSELFSTDTISGYVILEEFESLMLDPNQRSVSRKQNVNASNGSCLAEDDAVGPCWAIRCPSAHYSTARPFLSVGLSGVEE